MDDQNTNENTAVESNPQPFTVNEDGTITVPLQFPVTFNDKERTELRLRRPKGRDLKAADDKSSMAMTAKLIGILAGVPSPVVDSLDAVDFTACGSAVAHFLSPSPRTGGN